jgi:hypothetical protein
VGEQHGAGGGAAASGGGGGVVDAQQVAGDLADAGEPAVFERRLGPVRGLLSEIQVWAPATAPAFSFATMSSACSCPIPAAARAWKTVNRASVASCWTVADMGQLLTVRVGVVLLGAHVVPPLSVRVGLATQFGSRTGTGARVSVAGARMMRQLVRGAVTAWARTTTAWRPAPPLTHVPAWRT